MPSIKLNIRQLSRKAYIAMVHFGHQQFMLAAGYDGQGRPALVLGEFLHPHGLEVGGRSSGPRWPNPGG